MKKMNKNYICFLIVVNLSIITSIGLWYLDNQFAFNATIPATIVYYGLFSIFFHYLFKYSWNKKSDKSQTNKAENNDIKTLNWYEETFGQIILFLFLAILGGLIGSLSGLVWWGAGGNELRTLYDSLGVGFILGASLVAFIATGF